MTRIVAVANQQAGVGKTSTVLELGAALAALGRQVLLVDLDAQARLTRALGVDPEVLSVSVHDVLMRGVRAVDAMTDTDSLMDVLPATIDLAADEAALLTRPGRETLLRAALADVVDEYDWVLIDCGPTLGIITMNALSLATDVIVPVVGETFSARALRQFVAVLDDVRRFVNPQVHVNGVLPVMHTPGDPRDAAMVREVTEGRGLPVMEPIAFGAQAKSAYRALAEALLREQ